MSSYRQFSTVVIVLCKGRLLCCLLTTFAFSADLDSLLLNNTSRPVGGGYYWWTVSVQGPTDALDSIEYVEYTLHPTFPDPVQISRDRTTGFGYTARGWGEFRISAKIVFKNGDVGYLSHWLNLRAPTTTRSAPVRERHGPITATNRSRYLSANLWEWTIFIEGEEQTLRAVQCVVYYLHSTFPEPVKRICERPGQGFPLTATGWGTFEVKLEVIFKDGTRRFLTHQLQFEDAKARVYVYRDGFWGLSLSVPMIYLDERALARIGVDEYFVVTVDPGHYGFSVDKDSKSAVTLNVGGGQQYYLRVKDPWYGSGRLEREPNEEEAKRHIRELRPVRASYVKDTERVTRSLEVK